MINRAICIILLATVPIYFLPFHAHAQKVLQEEDFFEIKKVLTPEDALLEVGGLVTLPNGHLAISTR